MQHESEHKENAENLSATDAVMGAVRKELENNQARLVEEVKVALWSKVFIFSKKKFLAYLIQNLSVIFITETVFQKTASFWGYSAFKCTAQNTISQNSSGWNVTFGGKMCFSYGGDFLPRI